MYILKDEVSPFDLAAWSFSDSGGKTDQTHMFKIAMQGCQIWPVVKTTMCILD